MYLQRWHGWCHMKLLPSRQVLCTPYNHAPYHFMQSHIRKVYACLAVTCHLHFWQNDRGLLRATAVTRGWNGYRNKSQHRKLTLQKRILPPLLQGFEPATFRSRIRRSNHWPIPVPRIRRTQCKMAAYDGGGGGGYIWKFCKVDLKLKLCFLENEWQSVCQTKNASDSEQNMETCQQQQKQQQNKTKKRSETGR